MGAFGTAAFALTTETIWEMGAALGGLRLAVIMLLGLIALWVTEAHPTREANLCICEKHPSGEPALRARPGA